MLLCKNLLHYPKHKTIRNIHNIQLLHLISCKSHYHEGILVFFQEQDSIRLLLSLHFIFGPLFKILALKRDRSLKQTISFIFHHLSDNKSQIQNILNLHKPSLIFHKPFLLFNFQHRHLALGTSHFTLVLFPLSC